MIWDINPILIQSGSVQIRYYGICFLITLLGGFWLWRWQILRAGRSADSARRFLLLGLIGVLIGGRIGHLLFYDLQTLLRNPLEALYFWTGGLASHGSSAGLLLALLLFSRQQKMAFTDVCDRLTFACAWGAAWVRIGNFFNSEIVGKTTGVPWGIRFPRHDMNLPAELVPLRHPTQLYEALLAFCVLATLLLIDRKAGGEGHSRGLLAASLLTMLFTGRFFIEFTKEYPPSLPSLMTVGQSLSIPFILAGTAGLAAIWWQRRKDAATAPKSGSI